MLSPSMKVKIESLLHCPVLDSAQEYKKAVVQDSLYVGMKIHAPSSKKSCNCFALFCGRPVAVHSFLSVTYVSSAKQECIAIIQTLKVRDFYEKVGVTHLKVIDEITDYDVIQHALLGQKCIFIEPNVFGDGGSVVGYLSILPSQVLID